MADTLANDFVFVKVDTDENPDLAKAWEVQGIPTMIRIDEGRETGRLIGYRPESQIIEFAQQP